MEGQQQRSAALNDSDYQPDFGLDKKNYFEHFMQEEVAPIKKRKGSPLIAVLFLIVGCILFAFSTFYTKTMLKFTALDMWEDIYGRHLFTFLCFIILLRIKG